MPINEGILSFSWWTNAVSRKVDYSVNPFCCCTLKHLNDLFDDLEASKHQHIHLDSIIYPGENMIYKCNGGNSMVKIISLDTNDKGIFDYLI